MSSPMKKRDFSSLLKKPESSIKYNIIKFAMGNRTKFIIVQNIQPCVTARKYFKYNRWATFLTKAVLAMKDEHEFVEIVQNFKLLQTVSDEKTLLYPFSIFPSSDLECNNNICRINIFIYRE